MSLVLVLCVALAAPTLRGTLDGPVRVLPEQARGVLLPPASAGEVQIVLRDGATLAVQPLGGPPSSRMGLAVDGRGQVLRELTLGMPPPPHLARHCDHTCVVRDVWPLAAGFLVTLEDGPDEVGLQLVDGVVVLRTRGRGCETHAAAVNDTALWLAQRCESGSQVLSLTGGGGERGWRVDAASVAGLTLGPAGELVLLMRGEAEHEIVVWSAPSAVHWRPRPLPGGRSVSWPEVATELGPPDARLRLVGGAAGLVPVGLALQGRALVVVGHLGDRVAAAELRVSWP